MALAEDLPIYKTASALSKVVFAGVRGLPRDVRIILGNKLMDECTQMTTLILRANSTEQRERHLLEIRERQKQAEALNQLIFDTTTSYGGVMLTPIPVRAYAVPVTVNPVTGLGGPDISRPAGRTTLVVSGFFVGSSARRYDGLGRSDFGRAGFLDSRSANPVQLVTLCLAAFGGGYNPNRGIAIMTNPARNPSAVSVFNFHSNEVRTVLRDGEPWFVATDVALALGYRNAHDAARNLSEHQKADTQIVRTSSNGTDQNRIVTIINESGLYRLVLRSRKPEAVAFSDWVTGEVLPAIRKTSRYATQTAPALPPKITLLNRRWLVSYDLNGKEVVTPVPDDACVMSLPQMLKALNEPNGMSVDTETLAAVANACVKRLAVRCDRYKLKSEGKPVPPAWEGTA